MDANVLVEDTRCIARGSDVVFILLNVISMSLVVRSFSKRGWCTCEHHLMPNKIKLKRVVSGPAPGMHLGKTESHRNERDPEVVQERILDGLSLGAKERDLEPIGHENTKIGKQNISPTSQKPGTARASLGTAVPPSRDLLLLLLGLQAILFWRKIYRGIFLEYTCLDFKSIVYYK
ncbi:hypothetical protein MTR_3g091230 [Medicago truncatula]|uniref:Uncharacterized protein n=1 Tax=Medicago truncatula TaxID=3880 RepID=G7J6U2_MEDTR|nr:hypothetical protein MTR_3g091230 [Medicago truncatula]